MDSLTDAFCVQHRLPDRNAIAKDQSNVLLDAIDLASEVIIDLASVLTIDLAS